MINSGSWLTLGRKKGTAILFTVNSIRPTHSQRTLFQIFAKFLYWANLWLRPNKRMQFSCECQPIFLLKLMGKIKGKHNDVPGFYLLISNMSYVFTELEEYFLQCLSYLQCNTIDVTHFQYYSALLTFSLPLAQVLTVNNNK